jgi:hypothetical protein
MQTRNRVAYRTIGLLLCALSGVAWVPRQAWAAAAPYAYIAVASGGVPVGIGGALPLSVSLDSLGNVTTINSDVTFGPSVGVMAAADGSPVCSPSSGSFASTFSFFPLGCVPDGCLGVHAYIASTLGLPRGTIFTCTFNVSPDTPSATYPVEIASVTALTTGGMLVADTRGDLGGIGVYDRQPVELGIDSVVVAPGAETLATAFLRTHGRLVSGIQTELSVSPPLSIPAKANGKPDCALGDTAAEWKQASSFAFIPSGCTAAVCTGVRILVLSTTSTGPLPDGTPFQCTLKTGGAVGVFPVPVSGSILSDPQDVKLPVRETAGTVTISSPGTSDCCQCDKIPPACGLPEAGSCGTCPVVFQAACGGSGQCATFTPGPPTTPTPTPTTMPGPCVGDCDGNGVVTVDGVVKMVNIALGTAELSVCPIGDADGSGDITVDEIITAVGFALSACPGR